MAASKAATLSLLLLAGSATAQEASTGIVADRLRPGLGPATLAATEGAETTPFGQVSMMLALGYLRDPISLYDSAGGLVSRPVRGQLVGTLGWEIGLPRRLALRVSLPVAMWNDGDRLRGTGVTIAGNTETDSGLVSAAGNLMVGVKVAFLGTPTQPGMHAALALDVTAPMGGEHDFAATAGPTIGPRLMLDYRLPFLSLVLDAAARFGSDRQLFRTHFSDELLLSGGVIGRLLSRGEALHLLAYVEAAGVVAASSAARPAELRAALRLVCHRFQVDVGAGGGLDQAVASPRYRVFAILRLPLGQAR